MKKKKNRSINIALTGMALPAFLALVVFNVVPMFGVVMAFKNYRYADGIWGSAWAGLQNFKYIFSTDDIFIVLRNTIGYQVVTMLLMNILGGAVFALILYEVKNSKLNRAYQTISILPSFISMVVVGYLGYMFLGYDNGILNQLIEKVGMNPIAWYSEAGYWPFIILLVEIWKMIGMAALYFYASLLSIDTELFEAAKIDGAGKLKQIWYVSVPELLPMTCIVLINGLGHVLGSNFDLFYNLPMNSEALYKTTDVLSTYLYRGLADGTYGPSSAIALFQSVVGFIMIIATNALIKKIDPDKAMF